MAEVERSTASAAASAFPQPSVRWKHVTDAPLAGLAMAREAGRILAWDNANNLYLYDFAGQLLKSTRTPVPLILGAISDEGREIIVGTKEGDLWWLGTSLEPRMHLGGHRHMIGLAINPHGQYTAVSLNDSHTFIYDRHGRRITDLLTHRPLKHLTLLAGQPYLVAAAEYGLAGCYELNGEPRWQDALWSSAGDISASGEGYATLVSCFSHGVQRYGLDGTNEGAYHLGGAVTRTSLDYDGKLFAAATLEGEILLVNTAGHVLWRQSLASPAREVLLDAAGRFFVFGQESGEITFLDLVATVAPKRAERKAPATPAAEKPELAPVAAARKRHTAGKQIRQPTWNVRAYESDSQAETAVLAMTENPVRVASFSNRKRVDIFNDRGEAVHATDLMSGVGRYIEVDASLIVAATDREVVVYDIAASSSQRFIERLVQISHLRIDSESGELVIVEERDRLSRFDLGGDRRWTKTFDSPIEGIALGADRTTAVTTEDGRLIVIDGDKRVVGEYTSSTKEVLAVARLGPRWITLAGKSQRVRSHGSSGSVEWETSIPAEAWRLVRLGSRVAARSAGGRLFVLDIRGQIVLDGSDLPAESVLFMDRAGEPAALFWRAGNLMVTDLVGRVHWRHISSETLGPVSAGAAGVACALGRELAFFAAEN